MLCPYDTPNTEALPLRRYAHLHHETKRLIESCLRRALEEGANGGGGGLTAFAFVWQSFNGFAACVTRQDIEIDIVRRAANCPELTRRFGKLMAEDDGFRSAATEFAQSWPIFRAHDLRATGAAFLPFATRADRIAHYLSVGGLRHQPECFEAHQAEQGRVPIDWPHTLHAVYRVRCNLFHEKESLTSETEPQIVGPACRVLSSFLVRSGLIEARDGSHTI